MTEEQGDQIIKLLKDIDSKLGEIEYNTSKVKDFSNDIWVLDDIKDILKRME
ncbi:hypothetical protein ACOSP6_16810 [Tenacibaculum sp. MEBiC06402]|uniref:hypothetical protein n=1 Tax=unclassified Tenacibaculum TaxID=2635139 RepID=UPI003B9D7E1F